MKIEFKIANQIPRLRFNSGDPKPTCGKCDTLVDRPFQSGIRVRDKNNILHFFTIYTYITKPYFILDTKSGYSVVYCSDYCMKKHNAKFTRK